MLPSWLRQLKKRFVGHGTTSPIRSYRTTLRVEVLEDRAVPTTTRWTGGAAPDRDFNGNGNTTDPGETGDLRWSNPGNWDNGVPGFNYDVIFTNSTPPVSANYINYYTTVRGQRTPHSVMDINETIGSLTIMGPGPTTGGNVGWLIVDSIVADPVVINSPFIPTTPATLSILGAVSYTGTSTGETDFQIAFSGNPQIVTVVDPAGQLVINGDISIGAFAPGPVGIQKLGPGTLALGGVNTFDGLVEVDAGTLVAASNFSLGTTGVGTTVFNGATLTVAAGNLRESLRIEGTGVSGAALNGGGQVSGGITLTSSATVGGSLTLSGVISGSGNLTTIGFDTLTNANTYLGATFVNAGILSITNDAALSPGSFTAVASGATLELVNDFFSGIRHISDETLFLNGLGFIDGGTGNRLGALTAAEAGGGTSRTTPAEWRSRIFLETPAAIGAEEFATLLLSGQLSNVPISAAALATLSPAELDAYQAYQALGRPTVPRASMTKLGKGTTIFRNANPDFAGDTIVTDGVLIMQGSDVLGPPTGVAGPNPGGSITVNSDIPTLQFATLEVQGQFTVRKNLTLNGAGSSTLNGVGSSGNGALNITDNPLDAGPTAIDWAGSVTIASPAVITTEATAGLTISGVIGGGATASLTKNRTGSLTLTKSNTFLGALTLRDGVTTITDSGALGGVGGAGTTVASGATLVLADGLAIANEPLTLSSQIGTPATLQVGGGTNLWTGVVNLVGNNQLGLVGEVFINTTSATGTLNFSNVVSGDAKLRKLGPGELRFTGTSSNTFTDTLQIDAGTVALAKTLGPNGTTVNAVAGPIVVGDGQGGNNVDVLRLDGSNQIPDSKTVTVNSSGLFNLNNFTETIGPLILQGGEVTTGAGSLILTTPPVTNPPTYAVTTLGAPDVSKITGNLFLGSLTRTFNFLPGPATVFSASANPAQSGANVRFTFTVSGNAGDPIPTGSVSFFDGNAFLATRAVNPATGTATFDTSDLATNLSVGSHTITGVYSGDARYSSQSVALAQPVVIVNPSERIALTSSADPALPGQAVTFTFSLAPSAGDPVPTGTVTFFDGPNPISGAVALTATGTAAFTTSALPVGAHMIRAVYSGDGTYAPAAVTLANQQVGTPATLQLSSSANPVVTGTPLTFTFTASGKTGDPTPSGSVEFFDGVTSLGTRPVSGGAATLVTSALTPGPHTIRAVYAGDPNFYLPGAVTLAPNQQVGFTPLLQVNSGSNQSVLNTAVTFTFTANGDTGEPTPTGTVTFRDNGALIGTVGLNASGMATVTTSVLTVGTHTITATYSGDNYYTTATVTLAPDQKVVAIPAPATGTTTLLVSSNNNSSESGESVTFTVTFYLAAGGAAATGTVQFFNNGIPLGGPQTVAGGMASVTTAGLSVGTHVITAQYSGDVNYGSGTVPLTPNQLVVNPMAVYLTTSVNPAPPNTAVTFTFNSTIAAGAPTPTGTVRFFDGGTQIGTAQTLPASGTVSVTTSPSGLSVGTHAITATFTPTPATTAYAARTATLAPALIVGSPPTMLLSSNSNPSVPGSLVRFTFAASGDAGAPVPTGTVTFFDNGAAIGSAVALTVGSASKLTNSLTPGSHTITARYSGDTNYSAGTVVLIPNQVVLGTPAVQLTSDANPVATGANVTFTFRVTAATGSPAAAGSVEFFDGATSLGIRAVAGGMATLTTNALLVGSHTIIGVYTGDAIYQAETLTFANQVVSNPPLPPLSPPPTVITAFPAVLQVNGAITGGAGAGITKIGPGRMELNGVNGYTGPTTVNGALGSLVLGVNNALPDTPLTITAGTLDVNGKTDAVPSLTGAAAGTLALNGGSFTVGSDNTSTTFPGAITGGGTLTKVGTGTLTLSGASPAYTGTTVVAGGTVLVNANQSLGGVSVQNGTTLGGTGSVGAVTVSAGGTVAPGTAGVGTLTAAAVTFNGGTFAADLSKVGAVLTSDRLAVTSLVVGSANPVLQLNLAAYTNPLVADAAFTILTTTAALPAAFRFNRPDGTALNNGDTLSVNGRAFTITYTGNSVTAKFAGLLTVGTITPSANPSSPGDPVTVTVTFARAASGDPFPQGTVTVSDSLGGTTFTPATVTLTAASNGVATTTATFTALGTHTVTATFTASTNGYVNATATYTQTVNRVTATSVTTSDGATVFGQAVTFTAQVTGTGGTLTGSVNFFNASTGAFLGTAGLDGSGVARLTTAAVTTGRVTIQAVYSGDATFRTSAGTVAQVVTAKPLVASGSAAGAGGVVTVYDPQTGGFLGQGAPFGAYAGGIKVAVGDVNGDGFADLILMGGPGSENGHVLILSGRDFSTLADYRVGYGGELNIAAGDVNGDGKADVILSTATDFDFVAVYSGATQNVLATFSVFGGLRLGVTLAAGDFDGDGRADIFAGTASAFDASGFGAVLVVNGLTGQRLGTFLLPVVTKGVSVAAADVNGDGRADVAIGTLSPVGGIGPIVGVYDAVSGGLIAGFAAFPGQPVGVRLSSADRDGDGRAEIVTSFTGGVPVVAYYTYNPATNSFTVLDGFLVQTPGIAPPTGGLNVGGSV